MKVIAADASDYQSGANWHGLAQEADGIWAKWADWSWWARYGSGENLHETIISAAINAGKPAGSYLFARPGWTSAEYQVDVWADNCPAMTMSSMLDLESPGYLTGVGLTEWVNAALAQMWVRFGRIPVLYWSKRFSDENGMGVITVPHIDMVAEYHRGYQPFYYAARETWEGYAYSAYGGPDLPRGEVSIDVWQFTSSARFPSYDGSLDCSFITDEAFAQCCDIVPDPERKPLPLNIEEALVADERFDQLMATVSSLPDLIGTGGKGAAPAAGHYRPAPVGAPADKTEDLYAGLYQGRPPQVFDWSLNGEQTRCVAFDFTYLPAGAAIQIHAMEVGDPDPGVGFWGALVNSQTQVLAATWWGQHATFHTTVEGFHTIVHPASRPVRVVVNLDQSRLNVAPALLGAIGPPPRLLTATPSGTPDPTVALEYLVGGLNDLAEQVKFALAKHPTGVGGQHAADIVQSAVDRALANAAAKATIV